MKICVLGAGAWGTALAISAGVHSGGGHRQVTLWARDATQACEMALQRENTRYLPGHALPPGLNVVSGTLDVSRSPLRDADLVVIGSPMVALRGMLAALSLVSVPVVWICKGFESPQTTNATGLLGHEVCAQVAPDLLSGVLSGPSFAQEVARGQPSALVAASDHARVRDALVAAFHGPTLRVYVNDDVVGVEVGGAVKNILAIATGLCDGLSLGLNARAALITRGLAEMTRLGLALGARAETFMGLSGLGDLVLTATGDLSRNRKIGQLLAQGMGLTTALESLGHVAEGVYSARTVIQRAHHLGVEMPISEAVLALLDGRLQAAQAVSALMERGPRYEAL